MAETKKRRFGGTMLMGNLGAPQPPKQKWQSSAPPPAATPPPTVDLPSDAPPAKMPARGRFKKTMVGMASTPPSGPPGAIDSDIPPTRKRSIDKMMAAHEAAQTEARRPRGPDDRWDDTPSAPPPRKRSWGWGIGCLGATALLCCVGGWWVKTQSVPFIMTRGGELAARASLIPMVETMGELAKQCARDRSRLQNYLAPGAAEGLTETLCALDHNAVIRGAAGQPDVRPLAATPDRSYADATSNDANTCYRFVNDDAKIIGCWLDGRYRVLHAEELK